MPETTPEVPGTLAVAELLLLHVPPDVVSVSVMLKPSQILELPVMAVGVLLTVSIAAIPQPVARV